jgi:hypothetical protein
MKVTTHLNLVARSIIVELYLHAPVRRYGVVLNELRTGATLPYLSPTDALTIFFYAEGVIFERELNVKDILKKK